MGVATASVAATQCAETKRPSFVDGALGIFYKRRKWGSQPQAKPQCNAHNTIFGKYQIFFYKFSEYQKTSIALHNPIQLIL